MRDTDIGTIILHPDVSRRLARNLLIDSAGVLLLGEHVGHRAAEDDVSGLGRAGGLGVDKDAKIEATLDPRAWRENDVAVVVAHVQMVSDHGSDRLRLAANLLPETLGSALVLDGKKEVAFIVSG